MKNTMVIVSALIFIISSASPVFARGSSTFELRCYGSGATFGIAGISSDADGVVVTDLSINSTPVEAFNEVTTGELSTTRSLSVNFEDKHYDFTFKDLGSNPRVEIVTKKSGSAIGEETTGPEKLHCEE